MVGCSIKNCKSRSVKGGEIRFFSFPTKQSVANEWLRYCGPKTTTKNGRVCSNHFLPTDYFKSLQHILLNESPRKVRQLKPDALPTLMIDDCDGKNTQLPQSIAAATDDYNYTDIIQNESPRREQLKPEESSTLINGKNTELSQSNTIPATEVAHYPEIILDESPRNVRLKPDTAPTIMIADVNGKNTPLSQPSKTTANAVTESSKIVEKSDKNISISLAGHELLRTTANEFQVLNDKSVTISLAEYELLKRTANEFQALNDSNNVTISSTEHKYLTKTANKFLTVKDNLERIFTAGQVRCLMKPYMRRRVKWSTEDIAAAMSLRNKSPKCYRYLRVIGIPLPSLATLRNWKSKVEVQSDNYNLLDPVRLITNN